MLVKRLHIFTLLFLIFRSILTFVVGRWCCCCCSSAQECTQEEEPLLSAWAVARFYQTPGEAPTSELLSGTQPATDGRLHAATLPRLLFPIRLERRGSLAR